MMRQLSFLLAFVGSVFGLWGQRYPSSSYTLEWGRTRLARWHGQEEVVDLREDPAFSSLEYIAFDAFSGNKNIKRLYLPDGIKELSGLRGNTALTYIHIPNSVTHITQVNECPSLSTIDLPPNIEVIAGHAFRGCSALRKIYIPDNCHTIGEFAFKDCVELEEVHFPASLQEMRNWIFLNVRKMRKANIPERIAYLPSDFLHAFVSFKEVSISPSNRRLRISGEELYSYDGSILFCSLQRDKTGFEIPRGVRTVAPFAFYELKGLKEIVYPETIEEVGDPFPPDVEIERLVFRGVTPPKYIGELHPDRVDIGDIFIEVPREARARYQSVHPWSLFRFEEHRSLPTSSYRLSSDGKVLKEWLGDEINVNMYNDPAFNSVEVIGREAFLRTDNVKTLKLPRNLKRIESDALRSTKIKTLHIPASVEYIAPSGVKNFYMERYTVSPQNKEYKLIQDAIFSADGKVLVAYPNEHPAKTYTVPNSCIEIGGGAFADADLRQIILPPRLFKIGEGAFSDVKHLTELELPASVREIGGGAFASCSALKKINLPEGIQRLPITLFFGCQALTKLEIPSSVHYIGTEALSQTGISTLTLPASLSYMYEHRFLKEGTRVRIEANEPPSGYVMPEDGNTCILEVPRGTAEAYRAHSAWKHFNEIVEVDVPTRLLGVVYQGRGSVHFLSSSGETVRSGGGVQVGQRFEVVPTPEPGYKLREILVNGEVLSGRSVTIRGNTTVKVSFQLEDPMQIPSELYSLSSDGSTLLRWYGDLDVIDLRSLMQVQTIGYNVFGGKNMRRVLLPEGLKAIGAQVFYNCKNLEQIELPKGLQSLGKLTFAYCSSLKKVVIPEGVEALPENLFKEATQLQEVRLPASLKTIGESAFYRVKLSKLELDGPPPMVHSGSDYFIDYYDVFSNVELTVPSEYLTQYKAQKPWSFIRSIKAKRSSVAVEQPEASVFVYPNPVQTTLHIEGGFETIKVCSIGGAELLRLDNSFGQSGAQIDMQEYPTGFYLVTLERKGQAPQTFKIYKR